MRHSPSKLLFFGFMTVFMLLLVGGLSTNTVSAQTPIYPTDFIRDDTLFVYASLDGQNLNGSDQDNPVEITMDGPMELFLQINVSSTEDLTMSGTIVFYYQGIAIFPIQIVNPVTNSTWVPVGANVSIPPVVALIDLSSALSYGPIQLATGIFEASVDFSYYFDDPTDVTELSKTFYFTIPSDATSVITSVTGISATVATIGAVYGLGNGFMTLFEGLKTAYKLRGLHKKASELKSLPNMTVIGALPLLFSMLAGMTKIGKKKKKGEVDEKEDSAVSEYLVRQRLRETAPDAWPVDKCPKCKKDWNKKLDMCKKCNFTQDEARVHYADLLSSKVPAALKVMGKKKSTDIRTLAKKTKSTDYNAGVIAAAMVDTGVTEIVKVGTPLRSFVMNIAGLAFLVITWQQLLGDSASTLQTTLTLVGAAMSLAIIVALYVSRKTQVQKFQADMDDGKKWIPTDEEAAAEEAADEAKAAAKDETKAEVGDGEHLGKEETPMDDVVDETVEDQGEVSQEIAKVEDSETPTELDEDVTEEVDELDENSYDEDTYED
ncbi:MAG: hypothetical protein RTV31_13575 [Candidatus Thorarchaeota archaeon]